MLFVSIQFARIGGLSRRLLTVPLLWSRFGTVSVAVIVFSSSARVEGNGKHGREKGAPGVAQEGYSRKPNSCTRSCTTCALGPDLQRASGACRGRPSRREMIGRRGRTDHDCQGQLMGRLRAWSLGRNRALESVEMVHNPLATFDALLSLTSVRKVRLHMRLAFSSTLNSYMHTN